MAFATKNGLEKFQAVLLYVWHKFWYDGLLFRLWLKKSITPVVCLLGKVVGRWSDYFIAKICLVGFFNLCHDVHKDLRL